MANYKLEYSQIVRRKLKSLRAYLKAEYGEEVSKKSIKKLPMLLEAYRNCQTNVWNFHPSLTLIQTISIL